MARALELAERGRGWVHPNPLVGAVLVRDDGKILGEGRHARYGGPHAEVEAIEDARRLGATEADFARAALYVSLEPCAHHGKTPPCVEAILAAKIPVVHYALADPDRHGTEGGGARLKAAGVVVTEGMLAEEARVQNAAYLRFVETGLPRVTVKVAATLDGKVADAAGASRWITSPASRQAVDGMRAAADAVVVGIGTVRADDPTLRVRTQVENLPPRNPIRVVLDARAETPLTSRLVAGNDDGRTVVVVGETLDASGEERARALAERTRLLRAPLQGDASLQSGRLDLDAVRRLLARQGWIDLLVEAGPGLVGALLEGGLVDRLAIFFAPALLGGSGRGFTDALSIEKLADAMRFRRTAVRAVGDEDVLVVLERV